MRNSIISILLFSQTLSVSAQTIVLTCSIEDLQKYVNTQLSSADLACNKFGGNSCLMAEERKKDLAVCEASGLNYAMKREYIFDKSALNSNGDQWIEVSFETCWASRRMFKNKLKLSSSTIYFLEEDKVFQVDRSTLIGGWSNSVPWTCKFKEMQLNNKL